ncbi:hypothetical protein NQ317_011351 [Molorchus minor]|uniref:HTH CENPB-type domain-containing protein n=1 Tax=Molorchus minor TaxID=1323400 RepID=A0ABQ9IX76_9CUCU|nr:hypothetical protein NQ317_011351 [Molorchus minor]
MPAMEEKGLVSQKMLDLYLPETDCNIVGLMVCRSCVKSLAIYLKFATVSATTEAYIAKYCGQINTNGQHLVELNRVRINYQPTENHEMPKRKAWDPIRMKAAVQAMRNKEMGSFKASRVFGVPQTTLERYAKNDTPADEIVRTKMGRSPILPEDLEQELVRYCLQMEQKFFGLSRKDVRCMAYQLAIRNNLKNPFSKEKEQAGKKWLKNFMKRHRELSVRTPQGISYVRAKGFTQEAVTKFFGIYEPILEKIKHSPSRLYNCDETGITIVQHKHTKVVGLKGKKTNRGLTSSRARFTYHSGYLYEPSWTLYPSSSNFSSEKYETGAYGRHALGLYLCMSPFWMDPVRIVYGLV